MKENLKASEILKNVSFAGAETGATAHLPLGKTTVSPTLQFKGTSPSISALNIKHKILPNLIAEFDPIRRKLGLNWKDVLRGWDWEADVRGENVRDLKLRYKFALGKRIEDLGNIRLGVEYTGGYGGNPEHRVLGTAGISFEARRTNKLQQIIKEEIKQILNEQEADLPGRHDYVPPPQKLGTRSTTPGKRILQKAKEDFIKINIGQKLPQLYKEFAGTTKKPLTDQNKKYISRQIVNYINKVRLDFVCTGDSCRQGQRRVGVCPKDPDGVVQSMFYSAPKNTIMLCNWETSWSDKPPQKLAQAFAHELGQAKSYAIGRLAVTAGHKKEKYMSQQKTGGEGEAMPAYGASLYHKLKPYFNVSNKPDAPHEQQPEEVNAMRQQALQFLGRANLIPEDFQMICQRTSKRRKLSWKNKTPTAKNLSWEEFGTFYGEFTGLELWTRLKKKRACRKRRGLRKTMNTLARAGQPKGLPSSMGA